MVSLRSFGGSPRAGAVIDGSAIQPGLFFSSDPGTGLYLSAPNTIGFAGGGVSLGTWSQTGLILATPILLDVLANGGVRIQDGGAEIVQIRESTNIGGLQATLTAAGNQLFGATVGRLQLSGGVATPVVRRSLQLTSPQNDQVTLVIGLAANPAILGLAAEDEDGSDNEININYGKGGRDGITNTEELVLGYVAATTEFVLRTSAGGTGTQRELSLQTGATKRFRANATGIGLYDVTPVARAGAIAAPTGGALIDAEARTAINSIRTALTNIGLTS